MSYGSDYEGCVTTRKRVDQFNVHTVHIRRIRRKNQQYALIVPSSVYFYVLAPTCFGSSLPSSGSLLDPPELLEKHN
jgi:hypothetical protein